MKITLCGSMSFADKMIIIKKKLEKLGHKAFIPSDTSLFVQGKIDNDDLTADKKHCIKNNIIKDHFKLIEGSEGILVLNYKKNQIDGYVGTSTLMEIGLAYYLNKKIFLLKKFPSYNKYRWAHELEIIRPIVVNEDLLRIS